MGSLLFVPYRTPEASLYAGTKTKARFSNADGDADARILSYSNLIVSNRKVIIIGFVVVVGIVVVVKMLKKNNLKLAVDTNREPCTMVISVETTSKQPIHIAVRDAYKPFTYYTDRSGFVNGKREFKVMMPLSPTLAIVEIFNEKVGNKAAGVDKSFSITGKKMMPLVTKFNCFDSTNKVLLSFIQFAKEFSERAAIISDNQSIYMSNDGRFRVDYFDMIRDSERLIPNANGTAMVPNPKYGQVLRTPARISHKDGRIELSKEQFKKYTVPMRIVILLHEFAHFYLNKNIDDESESDLNAVLVAMCIGCPRVEIHKAFIEIFKNTPTNQNRKRLDKIIFFINNFEKFNMSLAA